MRTAAYVFLVMGLGLVVGLVAYEGSADVLRGFEAAGWGVLLLPLYYLVPLAVFALAWRSLFGDRAPRYGYLYRGVWTGSAINWLLPVAQVGGEFVRARMAMKAGVPGALAGATVMVDKTAMAVSQMMFALLGIGLLMALYDAGAMALGVLTATAILSVLIGLFVWFQHTGMFGFLARRARPFLGEGRLEKLAGGADRLDTAIKRLYADPRRFAVGLCLRLGARFLTAVEIWIAMQLLGEPVGYVEAVMLESLGQAIRGAAFFVPGALGVQEGGFMLLGSIIGVGAETGLVLSLLKRVRELGIGLPALVLWQVQEGRWMAQARRTDTS